MDEMTLFSQYQVIEGSIDKFGCEFHLPEIVTLCFFIVQMSSIYSFHGQVSRIKQPILCCMTYNKIKFVP